MNAGAVITMVLTMIIVTTICGYLFLKILRTPPRPDGGEE